MNPIQLAIIAVVVILIIGTVGYYWYQEVKFKRMVEHNFNQATNDVITDENTAVIMDGVNYADLQHQQAKPILVKDKHPLDSREAQPVDKLFAESADTQAVIDPISDSLIPEDSAEAFFVKIDRLAFPFLHQVNSELDFIIDIVFEEPVKLKVLPEITQFTHKPFIFYVLGRDNQWQVFEKGSKYNAQALKLVVELIDKEGIISQAQIANIYNELYKFVLQNHAHIRQSNYEASISQIQHQIKHLANIELNLNLYLVTRDKLSYTELNKSLEQTGLRENKGKFEFINNDQLIYTIANESGNALDHGGQYNLLSINANLHLQSEPLTVVDKIFDFAERFMQQFESRLLTANKQIFGQKDYEALNRYVTNYVATAAKNGVVLGGPLLKRLF